MIQGRFNKGYVLFFPNGGDLPNKHPNESKELDFIIDPVFVNPNYRTDLYIHYLDHGIEVKDIDPFDDSLNRYAVILHQLDKNGKRVIPTRVSASTTLKGAQAQVEKLSAFTGLNYSEEVSSVVEYISIRYYSINEDLERAYIRHLKKQHGGG